MWRRPLLPPDVGRAAIAVLCGYEVVALVTPLPTISCVVERHPLVGVVLLGALGHHWFIEESEASHVR